MASNDDDALTSAYKTHHVAFADHPPILNLLLCIQMEVIAYLLVNHHYGPQTTMHIAINRTNRQVWMCGNGELPYRHNLLLDMIQDGDA